MAGICKHSMLLGTDVNATSEEILRAYSYKKSKLEELLRDARLSFDRKNDIFIQINQLRRAYQTLLLNASREHMRLQQQVPIVCMVEANNGKAQPQDDRPDEPTTPEIMARGGDSASNGFPDLPRASPAHEQIKESKAIDVDAENGHKEERPGNDPPGEEPGEEQAPCCGSFWFCC